MRRKLSVLKNIALVLVLILSLSIAIKSTNALLTFNEIENVDKSTYNTYHNFINENNVGKVWTDKSVFNNDITIDNNTIQKEKDEDFLVSLSALSVGIDLNLKEGNVKDIVILQDLSSSMKNNNISSSTGSITRLQASKNAINELLEIIEKINDSLSKEDEKFRISLVGFAGNGAQHVVFNLTEVNNSNLSNLKTKVNNMNSSVGTFISPGLNLCFEQIQNNGRKNVDSAIITFLDGTPNPASDQTTSIGKAKIYKNEHGIIMYSIIVNDSAQGGIATELDKVGQGLSSNYDNANSTADLGDQTGDSYYYIPKTADELINSFKNIIRTIQKKAYTLEKGSNLTFTDQLGNYMEVKRIKALYYNNVVYTKANEVTNDNETIYTFSNEVTDSFSKSSNLNTITIKVSKNINVLEGDIITIIIPHNLVPLVTYNVKSKFLPDKTVYTTTVKEAKPISIVYSSNVKSEVLNLYRTNDNELKEYINKFGSINNYVSKAKFYSNSFKDGINGTTEVSYQPFIRNNYYYYEDESYLYTKSNGVYSLYTGSELQNGSYYIKKIVYNKGIDQDKIEAYEEVKSVKEAVKDSENHWYFRDTTKKEINTIEVKEENVTNTAINVNNASWNNNEIKTLLGNNGVVIAEMDVDRISIKVNKVWEDSNNESGQRPKSIKVKLKRNKEELKEYEVELNEANNWSYTYENLPLKIDGEEMKYTILEEKLSNYTVKIEGSQEEGFTITNTIIVENPYTGFKTAIIVIVLSIILIYICYYFRDKRNRLYKI